MRKALFALVVLLTFFCAPAVALPLVVNGGFETGDFTGWSRTGDLSFTGVSTDPVYSGNFAAFFGPVSSMGYLSQTLATAAGSLYNLHFMLRNNDSNHNNAFAVWWDGDLLGSVSNCDPFDWTHFVGGGLTASTASTDLTFGFYNPPSYFYLDDVSVESAAPVPEPASILLIGGGLALCAILLRRRWDSRD